MLFRSPKYTLEVGAAGTTLGSLYVNGQAKFVGFLTTNDLFVSGFTTSTGGFNIQSSSGQFTSGVVTATTLHVGSYGNVLFADATAGIASVGIGSTQPRGKLDVQGHTRLKTTSSDNFSLVGVNGGICALDLSISQNFIVDVTESISKFTLSNVPNGASDFTIRADQNSIGNYGVGIDTFRDSSNNIIPVYWPGGGVLPIVTLTASRSDIYSFKIINGSDILTEGIYGVVIGQNFAN